MPTSAQLERKAGRAPERLSDRIANLRYHVSPTTVVSDLLQGVSPRAWGEDVLPILAKQARNNPIASILIAAGVGLLIFSEVRGPLAKSFGLTAPRQIAKGGQKKKRATRNSRTAAGGRGN
jgi:hypothetical protein